MESIYYEGHENLRERLMLSIFSKKKILIKNIRERFYFPGIRKFEIDLLCLTDKLVPLSIIEINESGSIINFIPGFLENKKFVHKTSSIRSLSYFLEFIFYLILFNKYRFEIKLIGLRALNLDVSLETLIYVTLPIFRKIGLKDIRIKLFTNFFSLLNNTELLIFSCELNEKKDFNIIQSGILKKLRLIFSFSSNYGFSENQFDNLYNFYHNLAKIDYGFFKIKIPNKNIQFQTISLIAESSTGCILGEDFTLVCPGKKIFLLKKKTQELISLIVSEINSGSCFDARNQIFLLFRMLFKGKSKSLAICIGNLTLSTIKFFRDVKIIFGITFYIRPFYRKKSIIVKLI